MVIFGGKPSVTAEFASVGCVLNEPDECEIAVDDDIFNITVWDSHCNVCNFAGESLVLREENTR